MLLVLLTVVLIGIALREKNKQKSVDVIGYEGIKRERLIFWSLFLVALVLRIWQFGDIPYGANQDEAMAGVDAKALAEYGTDRFGMWHPVHFTAWGYGQMSVLMSYCMVPFIKLFGFSSVSIRLPLLIFSMLGILAVYFLGKRGAGDRASLFILALCAINPWHFMQSRWALDCNMFPHVLALSIFFLVKGVEKHKYLYLSMLFAGLCMYCYGIALYTVPIYLLVMCVIMLRKKIIAFWEAILCALVYLCVAGPFLMTMMINVFKWKTIETPLFTMPFFPDSIRSRDILFFSADPIKQVGRNIKSLRAVFTTNYGISSSYVEGYSPVAICLLPFAFLGLVCVIKSLFVKKEKQNDTKEKVISKCAILTFLFIGVMAGILTNGANVNRVNIIFYPVLILVGIGFDFVFTYAKKYSYGAIAVWIIASVLFVGSYFGKYAEAYKEECYTDFIDAVQYLQKTKCESYVITPDTQYEGSANVSEIMTLYAQNVDARYFQNLYADENGLYYKDKYKFENAKDQDIDETKSEGYVVCMSEEEYFSDASYEKKVFGNYLVAVPND